MLSKMVIIIIAKTGRMVTGVILGMDAMAIGHIIMIGAGITHLKVPPLPIQTKKDTRNASALMSMTIRDIIFGKFIMLQASQYM